MTDENRKRLRAALRGCARVILLLCAAYALYFALGAVLPYISHKDVSVEIAAAFSAADVYGDGSGGERVMLVSDNQDALEWRIRLISQARSEIVYSTMDFRDDDSGRDVMAAMAAAAERGVRVRIVADGLTSSSFFKSDSLLALASYDTVEVRRYAPLDLLRPWLTQTRIHDKYILVDGCTYMLGGRNTSNLFLGEYGGRQNIDRELLIYDEGGNGSAAGLKAYFEAMWAQDCCRGLAKKPRPDGRRALLERYEELKELYPTAFEAADMESCTVPADRVSLLANPQEAVNKEPLLWYELTEIMASGGEVIIQTPYLMLGKEMYSDLKAVCGSADVSIITNSAETGANVWGCADYLNQSGKLRAMNCTLYELVSDRSCHMKTILVDDRLSLVGSFNFDMRSCYLDTELMFAVDCPELNRQMRDEAEAFRAQSRIFSSGEVSYGENYAPVRMKWYKTVVYSILRVVIVPIRHLM